MGRTQASPGCVLPAESGKLGADIDVELLTGSGPLTVGGSGGTYTQGDVDEIAFYNRALTAQEIRARWNAR